MPLTLREAFAAALRRQWHLARGHRACELHRIEQAAEAALRLAGFDRFALDRLAVDGLEPVGSGLNRLRGVLDRLATLLRCR